MLEGKPEPDTFRLGIYIRGQGPRQMRKHDQAVRTGRYLFHLLTDHIVGILTSSFLSQHFHLTEFIPEPAQGHASVSECVDHIHSVYRETEQGHFTCRIKYGFVDRNTYGKCRTHSLGEHALPDISCTDGACRLVKRAGADRKIRSEAQLCCYLGQDFSHYLPGFPDRGKL